MPTDSPQLHRAQISILRTIRRAVSARYTDLLQPTGMDSDTFKFHLRKLINLGYIEKTSDGQYQLTVSGKEFANNLDRATRAVQKQPKLSVMIVARQTNTAGEQLILIQKRFRNPAWGYCGFISGPVRWGATPEETAGHELMKQTGLTASFRVRAFFRELDYATINDSLLEDKQFIIVEATSIDGSLSNSWSGGHNTWVTAAELQKQDKVYANTFMVMNMLEAGDTYQLHTERYDAELY